MKSIKKLLAIFFASVCSIQGMWAERVAPTLEAKTIESGKSYDLYNVGYQNYAHWRGSYACTGKNNIEPVLFTQKENGRWTMYFIWSCKYFNGARMSDTPAECEITQVEGGYTFSFNGSLLTASGEYYDMYTGGSGDNATWIAYDDEELWHYFARKSLYDALEVAEENDASVLGEYETLYSILVSKFEAIYENETSTTAELNAAASSLKNSIGMSQGYQAPWWNEYPIMFYTPDGNFGQNYWNTWVLPDNYYTTGTYFWRYINSNCSTSISATIAVDEHSTLVYSMSGFFVGLTVEVYIDGLLVRTLWNEQVGDCRPTDLTYSRFFEALDPGVHTITWKYINYTNNDHAVDLRKVGVMKTPNISVSLLEPGSLGTEVLYNTDHVKNVRSLKVKGKMNDNDWAKIKMMSRLLELDLSEAEFTEIPEEQFQITYNDTTMQFMHALSLPEGVQKINRRAFYYSFIEHVNLPSTLKIVGYQAFRCSRIQELIMPDDFTEWGGNYDYPFQDMRWLKKAVLPKNLTYIPPYSMSGNYFVNDLVLPENVNSIGEGAFDGNWNANPVLPEGLTYIESYAFKNCGINPILPNSLKTIRPYAFQNCISMGDTLRIPENVSEIGEYAFVDCGGLKCVEISSNINSLNNRVFRNCPNIQTIKLNSPTVVKHTQYFPVDDITRIKLQVPHYLVNNYKLDDYWYNAVSIEPFDYSKMENIYLRDNLTLNHERFGGQPSITIYFGSSLKINGENEQKFNVIWINNQGQLLNNCDNITAIGDNKVSYWTDAKKWYFISLPFDLEVSRITPETTGTQYAIRYYDGAGRAANGKSGNWKNVDRTGIIPAGTGFIYQTNIATYTQFFAANTENKYGTLRNTEFIKTLDVNASETTSNKGWNLVGNPYQCYYNNHCLNFTAPITVWNGSTYVAYSLTDDDYAIRPNEAFFVQCPNEEYNTIGFPLQGRQLTSVIESQNAVKAWASEAKSRQVVNLTVSNGEMEDMTRVVLNEEASMAYETSCDASKFMSMDGSVPQIYTLDGEGTWYAINERPIEDGSVALGFYAGQEGSYTISVTRCDAEKVFITDNLTGETTDITNGAYTFSAKAGTDNTRFTLSFIYNDPTAIVEIDNGQQTTDNNQTVYDLNGRQIVNGKLSNGKLSQGIYVIRQGKKASKVVVR